MQDLGFIEMQEMQRRLQDKYKDKWESVAPENGKNKLLWLLIELGEAADIIKKSTADAIMTDEQTRKHFIEELTDVLMYYNDVMLCFGITVDELKEVYLAKHEKNMSRW